MKAIKFWIYTQDRWQGIILSDGQKIVFESGGKTEEGFNYCTEILEYSHGELSARVETSARDCDGPMSSSCYFIAKGFEDFTDQETGVTVNRPIWEKIDSEYYDAGAVDAGY